MTLLRLCPQAEPSLAPISAKWKDGTMMQAELTLGEGDQDREEAPVPLSKEGEIENAHYGAAIFILFIVCFVLCCVSGVWHIGHIQYLFVK